MEPHESGFRWAVGTVPECSYALHDSIQWCGVQKTAPVDSWRFTLLSTTAAVVYVHVLLHDPRPWGLREPTPTRLPVRAPAGLERCAAHDSGERRLERLEHVGIACPGGGEIVPSPLEDLLPHGVGGVGGVSRQRVLCVLDLPARVDRVGSLTRTENPP